MSTRCVAQPRWDKADTEFPAIRFTLGEGGSISRRRMGRAGESCHPSGNGIVPI